MRANKNIAKVIRLALMSSLTKNPNRTFKSSCSNKIEEKFKNRRRMNSKNFKISNKKN